MSWVRPHEVNDWITNAARPKPFDYADDLVVIRGDSRVPVPQVLNEMHLPSQTPSSGAHGEKMSVTRRATSGGICSKMCCKAVLLKPNLSPTRPFSLGKRSPTGS